MSQRDLEAKTQTKLAIHRLPADEREEEEEGPIQRLQRQYGNRATGEVLDRKAGSGAEVAPEVEDAIQRARGGGQALDNNLRAQMESAFGADFGGVRVHTDAEADTLNRAVSARAFTTGQDIFFRQGEYSPSNSSGRELLAHELAHVVQQGGGRVARKLTLRAPGDKYEQEADQAARTAALSEQQVARDLANRRLVNRHVENEEELAQRKSDDIHARKKVAAILIQLQREAGVAIPTKPTVSDVSYGLYPEQIFAAIRKIKTNRQWADYLSKNKDSFKIPEPGIELERFILAPGKDVRGQDIKVVRLDNDIAGGKRIEWLRFQKNGLICFETQLYGQKSMTVKKRQVTKLVKQLAVLKHYDVNGTLIKQTQTEYDEAGRPKRKGPQEASIANLPRQKLEQKLKQRELSESTAIVENEMRVKDLWELTNPQEWTQSWMLRGVTPKVREAYKTLVDEYRNGVFKDAEDLSKEKAQLEDELQQIESGRKDKGDKPRIEKRIKQILQAAPQNLIDAVALIKATVVSAEEKRKVWGKRAHKYVLKPEVELASGTAEQLCNIISYYLYGRASGKIPASKPFSRFFIDELKKGRIGLVSKEYGEGEERALGMAFGSGSGNWREEFGMRALANKSVPITHRTRQNEYAIFRASGVRIAISWQHIPGGKAGPHHFLLIIKDRDGVWRNMDHTSERFDRRGGPTDFKQVYGLNANKDELDKAEKQLQDAMRAVPQVVPELAPVLPLMPIRLSVRLHE
jgi:hypothetical protein